MKAPDKIYLTEELADEGTYLWCEDRITAEDTEYLRADLAPRWISVLERLPEVGVDVLCLRNDEPGKMVVDYLERRSVSDGNGVQFVKNYIHNYSHWQPLPEAPDA